MAKFDIKSDLKVATKPLYAGVGATDLAVERVRGFVTEAQKRVAEAQKNVRKVELEPQALRDQAVTRVNARVDALAKDAKARRTTIEKRVGELQSEALATVGGAYGDLVSRGESLVTRIRRQESTTSARSSARTTTSKAKTTRTQATNAAKSTTGTAKKTAARKSGPARSSAKATTTAAKQTASDAAQAAGDAAAKVGD